MKLIGVSREEIIWAYRMLLGREPESARVIEGHMWAEDREALRRNVMGSPEYEEARRVLMSWVPTGATPQMLQLLRDALAEVDGYQPVYKFESLLEGRDVSRTCLDRCVLLENELSPDIRNLRILDVGCSMGYLSLFFAERGASVSGIDYHQPNINLCNVLSRAAGIRATFTRAEFSESFCAPLVEGSFDVAFLFSVLHHVTQSYGVPAVQRMMEHMLDKCDVLYVELARKSEDVPFEWRQALPENELEIFAGIPDIEIECLGEFPALGDTVIRPLYRVRKTAKVWSGHTHRPLSIERSAIKDGRTRDRKYAVCDEYFTKLFVIDNRDLYLRFTAELDVPKRIGEHRNFLPIVGSELRGCLAAITYPRARGKSLIDALNGGDRLDVRAIALDIAEILRALHRAGLFWNDLRSHNLIVTDRGVVATDFEAAAPVELENTLNLYLWLLYDLHCGQTKTQDNDAFDAGLLDVPRPPIEPSQFVEPLRDLAERAWACSSIADLCASNEVISGN